MTIDISNNDPRISYSVAQGVTQTSFAIPFEFFDDSDVNVYVDGTLKTITTDYTISGGNGSTGTVSISVTGQTGGSVVVLTRDITIERTTDFTAGADINRAALNTQLDTLTAIAADVKDRAGLALSYNDRTVGVTTELPDVANLKGKTLAFNASTGAPEAGPTISEVSNAQTYANNSATSAAASAASASAAAGSASAAAGSASAAASSESHAASSESAAQAAQAAAEAAQAAAETAETNAETAETNAASSASAASTSASNAASSASAASTSASNAATSETNASNSATAAASSASAASASQVAAAASAAAAAASYDTFDDRYLGTKTSDPTLDNDGNTLVAGALYFNSVANEMRVYDGANWIPASSAGGVSLLNYNYTATAGQTTFSGADDNAANLSYTQQNLIVTLNGIVLEDGTDYTASNGTSIVLSTGAAAGDELNVVAFKSFTTADMVPASTGGTFSGNVAINGNLTVDTDTLFVDAANNRVGVGTTSPAYNLDITSTGDTTIQVKANSSGAGADDDASLVLDAAEAGEAGVIFRNGGVSKARIEWFNAGPDLNIQTESGTNGNIDFQPNENLAMRIASNGDVGIAQTSPAYSLHIADAGYTSSTFEGGISLDNSGVILHQTNSTAQYRMNDSSSTAGTHNYIIFYYQGSAIGDIDSADNSVIRYNTFTGAHWSQMHGSSDLLRGTVMSTLDELLEWTNFEFINAEGQTEKTTMAGTDYVIGQTYTIPVDEDGATAEGTATGYETASRLMRVKVSDVEGDPAVYGVFSGAYADGDISVEALGAGVIRIGAGVTVQRGDLLMSAGDGTAKPQDDDIVRSKTIAKVTGNVVLETFDDGSYLVACVLMAG